MPDHILLALLQQEGGLIALLIAKVGADPKAVAAALERNLEGYARASGGIDVGLLIGGWLKCNEIPGSPRSLPEPGMLSLLALGGLALLRRKAGRKVV